jgi:hypothetical protein
LTATGLGLRLLAAITALAAWGVLAVWWAGRGARGAGPLARLSAALCAALWVCALGFQLLALLHVFTLWLVAPIWAALPALAAWRWRRSIGPELEQLTRQLRAEWSDLAAELHRERWLQLGLTAVAVHLAARAARALIAPTLGWDDLTYHLFRAARWVQAGGIVLEPAPDAWTSYEFYPWGGDLVWAWTLVWGAGDALVPWAAIGTWVGCLATAYALARELGQRPLVCLLVATALALTPAAVTQIETAYVDNAALLLVLAATLFLVERHRIGAGRANDPVRSSLLLGMACGLGVLVKTSLLPIAAIAALATVGFAAARRRLAPLFAFAAGAGVAAPNLAFNWIQRGSPFYPFHVPGFASFDDELAATFARFAPADSWHQGLRALAGLFTAPSGDRPFLNLGTSAAILLGVGLVGARRIARRPGGAVYLCWCFGASAITAWQLLRPENGSMLTLWAGTLGRLLAPALAAWMVLAALVDERWVRRLLAASLVAEYFLRAPWPWPPELWAPTAILIGASLLCGLVLHLRLRGRQPRLRLAWLAASIVFVAVLGAELRSTHRYDAYRLVAERRIDGFDRAAPVDAWPAWQRLDGDAPATIAATAGWDGIAGHNWFRYPLLGSRLQNRVVYVPVSADGSLASYADRDALRAVADRRAWLARLARTEVDWVFAMNPPPIEAEWIRELPDVFAIDASLPARSGLLARVDRRKLAAQLEGTN